MELAIEELVYQQKRLKGLRKLCKLWLMTMHSSVPTAVFDSIDEHVKQVEFISERVREDLGIDPQKWLELQTFMTLLKG